MFHVSKNINNKYSPLGTNFNDFFTSIILLILSIQLGLAIDSPQRERVSKILLLPTLA